MKFFENPQIYKIRYGIITSFIIFVCIFWDQFFKIITDGYNIIIIKDFFNFISIHNDGAAYGSFSGKTNILIVVTILILMLIFVYNWLNKNKSFLYCTAIGLIVGGAIGNLIDRIFLGYVRDFIKFSFLNFNFNIADACLTIGVILFAIYLIFQLDRIKKKKKNEQNNS